MQLTDCPKIFSKYRIIRGLRKRNILKTTNHLLKK